MDLCFATPAAVLGMKRITEILQQYSNKDNFSKMYIYKA